MGDSISILRVLICYGLQSDIKVITYGHLNFPGAFVFNFGILDIFWESIWHSIQKLRKFEFARRFFIKFWESRYVTGRNQTSESRLIIIWICPNFRVEFQASRYMLGLNQTSMSNVIAVWICSSFRVSRYLSQKLLSLEYPWSFRISSRASRYVMSLNRKLESKVIAVWIFQ